MIASKSASSSPNEVSIRQATPGIVERISRHTLTPSPSGSRTSSTATSGFSAGMRASADAAADDLMIIEEEHADLAGRRCVLRRHPVCVVHLRLSPLFASALLCADDVGGYSAEATARQIP